MWNKLGESQTHFSNMALTKLSVSIPVGGVYLVALLGEGNLPSAI